MKNLIFIALLLSIYTVSAQNIAPIGSTWFYRTEGYAGNPILDGIQRMDAIRDTIINASSYRVIECKQLRKGMPPRYIISYYFRDSAGFVSFWYKGKVYPFFNFNASKGDTVVSSLYEPSNDSFYTLQSSIDSVYTDSNGLKSYVYGNGKVVKQQLFHSWIMVSFLEAVRFSGPMNGNKVLRCFSNNNLAVKLQSGPCDSIPYHRFNNQIQYYFSMWKPHGVRDAPYFRLIKDTAADNNQFWLRYYNQNNVRNSSGDVLFKEDVSARKLYVWKGAWYVLYDFAATKGDTITSVAITNPLHILNNATGYESVQQFKYVIDSVYEEDSKLVQIPKSLPGELWTIPGKIYEGIGSDIALLGWPTQYDTTGRDGYLRCFFNSDWGIHFMNPNKDVEQCNSTLTGLADQTATRPNQLLVYPNPTSTSVTIHYPLHNGWLKVYDTSGKCKGTFIESSIDVSQWTDGLYFVLAYDGSHYASGTFSIVK